MPFNTSELIDQFPQLIIDIIGENVSIQHIAGLETQQGNSLVFLQDANAIETVINNNPSALVTSAEIAEVLKTKYHHQFTGQIIIVGNVRLAQALIKQTYDDYQAIDTEWPQIHPSAIIHPTAIIADSATIGANTVIGAHVKIANNSVVRANCVIEHNVSIGDDTIINNLVNIGYDCTLGARVIIQSGCIIGNEGFGFAQDNEKRSHRIPHTGTVVIEDDVQIGSNSNIDRATYGKTIIGKRVKIDALCHIAHNVEIGADSIIVAQTGIAGSSKIGERVTISGQAAISDHKVIADDVTLVHRAGVSDNINEPGMWAGIPAKPWREYIQSISAHKKLNKLQSEIKQLRAQLAKDKK